MAKKTEKATLIVRASGVTIDAETGEVKVDKFNITFDGPTETAKQLKKFLAPFLKEEDEE